MTDDDRATRAFLSTFEGGEGCLRGAVLGLVSVPDGLGSGLLAGVNPIAGLYGYLFGTVAGALATSSFPEARGLQEQDR